MNILDLQHDNLLQGSFTPGKKNFLFTFQVNCPGCFLYGIPVFNRLYHDYGEQINFLGLSTAFEDFNLNTEENTRKLLTGNELVGETKKALKERGFDQYPESIDFPVTMDSQSHEDFINDDNVARICQSNPNYKIWPEGDRQLMREKVEQYLKQMPLISHTFTINQFRGTPTFVLFDEEYNIYKDWFGHQAPEETKKIIDEWLS